MAVGIRGGLNWAKMTDKVEILETPEARIGPAGALIIRIPLTERLSLAPEIGFIQRGGKQEYRGYSPDLGYGQHQYHMVRDSAELAALAKFYMGSGLARSHLLAAATVGGVTGARQYNVGPDGGKADGEVLDPNESGMNLLNVDICGGTGLTFTIGELKGLDRSIQVTAG